MKRKLLAGLAVLTTVVGLVFAQRTAREEQVWTEETPRWTNDPAFSKDVFTWVRLKYSVNGEYGFGRSGNDRWKIDFPDCDLNLSFRLQQMTSLKVDPDARAMAITEKDLAQHPFVYIVEPGRLTFEDEELPILRKYLLNGGFLLADDFWGDWEWANFQEQLARLFPDRRPVDLGLDHPVFNGVFTVKEKPQIPGIELWENGHEWDRRRPGSQGANYRAILDDKGRVMVLICHNTDLGDAWEKEGANPEYFRRYSEKFAYPLGINIIFYAMTH